jgi:hypothetical protein
MPFKPKINVKLVKCGTCGKSYNNPLKHVCKLGFNQTGQRRVQKNQKRGR